MFKDVIKAYSTNVIRCSGLRLWVGYFIYFKFTHVSSIVYKSLHLWATSKTWPGPWTLTLDPDPGPRPRTQIWTQDVDPEKPGPWKTWNLKKPGLCKPGPWKTWTQKNLALKHWTLENLDHKKRGKQLHVEKWLEYYII